MFNDHEREIVTRCASETENNVHYKIIGLNVDFLEWWLKFNAKVVSTLDDFLAQMYSCLNICRAKFELL
jgi:hypothetical protein